MNFECGSSKAIARAEWKLLDWLPHSKFFIYRSMQGWIKLHRKFRENPFYSNPNAIAIWVECMFRASHEDRTFYWKRERVTLDKGMFLFGFEELGKTFKLSRGTTRFWIDQFVVDGMLAIKKTNKGTIGTIQNWNEYQSVANTVANGKPTKSQRKATKKNVKKVKKKISTNVDILPEEKKVEIFDFKEKLQTMATAEDFRMWIIALYWVMKRFNFENKQQYNSALKRELRPAKNIQGYSKERIREVMEWLNLNAKDYNWKLETVHKFIDEDLNNLTSNQINVI